MNIDSETYYDILELNSDATPEDIRTSYLRLKDAYAKDNVAHYTLFNEEESQNLLSRIENAYQVLSDPERRRQYDQNHKITELREPFQEFSPTLSQSGQKLEVVSIDRVPPMETSSSSLDILEPPAIDYDLSKEKPQFNTSSHQLKPQYMPQKAPQPQPEPRKDPSLKEKIETETNWRGSTIRQFREAQGISIEEVSEYTKISKNYLRAIEEEQYAKLPAAVYLRGFLRTISKKLGIPFERVATTYLARYKEACPEKA